MQNEENRTNENIALELNLGDKVEIIESLVNLTNKDCAQILSVNACFYVESTEVLLGSVNYTGSLNLNVVFQKSDGSFENLQDKTNVSGRFENENIDVSSVIKIIPNIISNEIERVNGDSAKIQTNINLSFINSKNQQIDVYAGGNPDIFVLQSEIPLSTFVGKNCANFSNQIILNSKMPIKNVLSLTSGAIINKADSLESVIVFEGQVFARALVETNEERPLLFAISNFENFREEVEDGNATKNSFVEASASVVCPDVTSNILEDATNLEVNVPIRICYNLYETKNITAVKDAYALNNEIEITTTGFNSTDLLGNENFEFKIDGNVSLDETSPRVDKILCVDGSYLTLTNIAYADEEILIEGILHTNAIYLNDEENKIYSVDIEIPFSQVERTNIAGENINVKLNYILYDVDVVAKRGRDLYVDAKVKASASLSKTVSNAIVSNIEIGEECEDHKSSIEIYYANAGQTFWDIAKDLKVSEEVLKEQNLGLEEPFAERTKIVYYKQKIMNIE